MDSVQLTQFSSVRDGLRSMMQAADDAGEFVQTHVPVEVALLIVEVARRAPDLEDWFPCGKWATIQSIQERVAGELDRSLARWKATP